MGVVFASSGPHLSLPSAALVQAASILGISLGEVQALLQTIEKQSALWRSAMNLATLGRSAVAVKVFRQEIVGMSPKLFDLLALQDMEWWVEHYRNQQAPGKTGPAAQRQADGIACLPVYSPRTRAPPKGEDAHMEAHTSAHTCARAHRHRPMVSVRLFACLPIRWSVPRL